MPATSTKTPVEQATEAYIAVSKSKARFDINNGKFAKRVNALDENGVKELQAAIKKYHEGGVEKAETQDVITVQ